MGKMSDSVTRWLADRDLEEYAAIFHDNKIDLEILPHLSVEDLKDMGITAVGDRRRIMRAIAELDACAEPSKPQPKSALAPQPIPAKRHVTVMFIDLSGFTRLTAGLDVEDTHAVLGKFFAVADSIVEKFGGTIDKHIGDAVMAVFGGQVSSTSDAEKAARAALEIHAAMATLVPPMRCHIGIASGQVIASATGSDLHTENTVLGDGVNLAARITDHAQAHETLISADIHLALRSRFSAEDRGEVALPGIAMPQRLWSLSDVASGPEMPKFAFVGREREVSLFRTACERCSEHGSGEIHVVLGEPGIGKTHLFEEIAAIAHDMGYGVHRAGVLDFGALEGRSALQDLVRSLLGSGALGENVTVLQAVDRAVEAGWIAPVDRVHLNALLELEQDAGVAEVYANMDNAARQRGRRTVMANLVRARSALEPLLLQIEDIHWATPDILSALAHVAATIRDVPCLLTMTSRIDGDPLDLDWQAQTGGTYLAKIELAGLSEDHCRELSRAIITSGGDDVDPFIQRAGGNPLFLEQLLRSRGATASGELPGSIQGIVQSRLDAINPEARRTIQAASVLGQRLSPEALAYLVEDDTPDLSALIRAGLMRESGADLAFAHALIRDGSYNSLFRTERNMLHTRAAKWFAGRDAPLHAKHLDRAESHDAPRAYLDAAESLIRAYKFEEAEPLLERALALDVAPALRVDLLGMLGEVIRLQGRPTEALAQCEAAAEVAETDAQLCRIHLEWAQSARQTSQYQLALDNLDIAEAAARRGGADASLAQVFYIRGNIYFPLGRFEEALASNEEALVLARVLGSVRLEVGALSGFGDAYFMNGSMRTAAGYYSQAVERARPDGLVRDVAANLHNLSVARSYSGDVQQGRLEGMEAVEISQTYFALVPECVAQTCLGVALTLLDEIEAALDAFARSAEVGRRVGAKRLEAQALEHLARTQVYAGQRAEARKTGHDAVEIALAHGPNFVGPKALSALALALDDPAEQDRLLAHGGEIIAKGCVGHNHLHFYPDACAIMIARGEADRARAYADALERFTEKEPLPLVDLALREIRLLAGKGARPAESDAAAALRSDFWKMGIRRSLSGRTYYAD